MHIRYSLWGIMTSFSIGVKTKGLTLWNVRGTGKKCVRQSLVFSVAKLQPQNIKDRATRIMFKHDFKYREFWQVEKLVLKFSAVLNIYNHHYLTAHQEHTVGNVESDCPGSKKHKSPYPVWGSNSSHEIQRNCKCILSDGGHWLILFNSLIKLQARREEGIFLSEFIIREILWFCYWPGIFADLGSKYPMAMPF